MASDPSLHAGKTALEQGDYPQAIALLQAVCDNELDEELVAEAQRLLILAQEGAGKQPQSTGFTPLGETLHPTPTPDITNTGFTPLDAPPRLGNKAPIKGAAARKIPDGDSSSSKSLGKKATSAAKTPGLGNQAAQKSALPDSSFPDSAQNLDRPPSPPAAKSVPSEPVALIPVPQRLPSMFADDSPVPWHNGERAKSWTPLKGVKLKNAWLLELAIALGVYFLVNFVLGRFPFVRDLTNVALFFAIYQVLGKYWMVQLGTAIAFFWLLRGVLTTGMITVNTVLANLAIIRLRPIQLFYANPTYFLVGVIAIVAAASPWLWDLLLQKSYNLKTLSVNQLSAKSPEALKLLRSFSHKKKIPFPALKILPTAAPVAFTYGNLPQTIRVVVSQGLLDSLTPDEIATIYAGEVGHIVNGDYALISIAVLILQIPYTIYWQVAYWGERLAQICHDKLPSYRKFLPTLVTWISAIVANFSYSIFWLLRLPLLWICRLKTYHSDRAAASITGNPNAISRSILKIAIATTQEMQRQGQTSFLLEGLELLTPLGYQQALLLGGSYRQLTDSIQREAITTDPIANLIKLLTWDCLNPCRQWLIWGYGHPLTGDRLVLLNRYAKYWKLNTEIDLPEPTLPKKSQRPQLSWRIIPEFMTYTQGLPLLQRAAIYGVVIGFMLRFLLWIVGAIGYQFYVIEIVWLFRNANPFHLGCLLIVGGLAIFLLINSYFPDIKPNIAKTELHLGALLTEVKAVPSQTKTARMTGQLLGRRGISNWLGQDLWLQAPQGLIKLNFLSALGAGGNLFLSKTPRPNKLVNRQVTVLGWWRRGVTPWIDVETLRSPGTKSTHGGYPLWATLLGIVAVLWGSYIIWQA